MMKLWRRFLFNKLTHALQKKKRGYLNPRFLYVLALQRENGVLIGKDASGVPGAVGAPGDVIAIVGMIA
jgi:hypothetical protein